MNANSQSAGRWEQWLVVTTAGVALALSLAAGTGITTGGLVQFIALFSLAIALLVLLHQTVSAE